MVIGLDIMEWKRACETTPYRRNDCPVCGYHLKTAVDGIIECGFCGWTDRNVIKRETR